MSSLAGKVALFWLGLTGLAIFAGYQIEARQRSGEIRHEPPTETQQPPRPSTELTPKIIKRAEWGANAPVSTMTPHAPARITIHHTATRQSPRTATGTKLKRLQEFSQRVSKLASGKSKPAWPDVPYHFYIAANGEVAEGREIGFVGDTNTGYNPAGHILIVLEGNFEEEVPTPSQLTSMKSLTKWLLGRFKIDPKRIGAHSDFSATACPGKNLVTKLAAMRAAGGM